MSNNMKPEQQRIAIAEACGFKITRVEYDPNGEVERVWAETPDSWKGKDVRPWLPDFLNDLNAMHEAWCSLDDVRKDEMQMILREIVFKGQPVVRLSILGEAIISNATADQRAEAFLRTIGKWVEL